jgi:hypothetical protein
MARPTAGDPLNAPDHADLHSSVIDVAGMFGTDATSVQDAFSAANDGDTLWFGDHTFECEITEAMGISLNGLTLTGTKGAVLLGPGGADPSFLILPDCSNVHVYGLSFDMNGVLSFGGLKLPGVQGANVHDNYFYDSNFQTSSASDHFGFIVVASTGSGECTDIHFHHNRLDHCQVELDHVQGMTVDHNVSRNTWHTTAFGMFTTTATDGLTSSDITFDHNIVIDPLQASAGAFCLSVDPATSSNHVFQRIRFTNNTIVDSYNRTAIKLGTVDNSQVATNITFEDLTIEGNDIHYTDNFTGTAIFANTSPTTTFTFDRLKIANNKLYGTGGTGSIGIDIRTTTDSLVYDNRILNFETDFVESTSTNLALGQPIPSLALEGNHQGGLVGGVEVFDSTGTRLGFMPVYDAINFDPVETTSSTLLGWYKADAIRGSSAGGNLNTWNDSSTTTTNDLIAPSILAFPTYQTSAGFPTVRFAGAANEYLFHQTTPAVSQPWSVVAVAKCTDITGARVIAGSSNSASQSHIQINTSGFPGLRAPTTQSGVNAKNGAFHVFVGIFNGASSKLWVDGTQEVAADPGSNGLAGLKVGADFTGSGRFVGDIAEVIFYQGALSNTDRDALETYLGAKYGIVVV